MSNEQSFQILLAQLRRYEMRRQQQVALLWLPRGLLAGLLVAAGVAGVARLRPVLDNNQVAYVAVAAGLLGLLVTLLALLAQRPNLTQQAIFADRAFGLQERLTTAIELHTGRITAPPTIARQQFDDTLKLVEQVNVPAGLPLRPVRQDWLMNLMAITLLAAAVMLPNPQETILNQQRAIQTSIKNQIKNLQALVEAITQNPDLTEEQKEELLEPIEGALEELQNGNLSQEEAVAVLSEAEAELQDLAASNDNQALLESLQTAGQPLANNPNSQTLGQALQNGDLSQASTAAAELADTLPELSPEEQAQLAEDLAATAEQLQGIDDQLAEQLAEAAQALQNGDMATAQQALYEASATLQQQAQQAAAAQQAATAANQLGQSGQEVAQADQQGQGQGQGEGQGQGQGQGEGQGQGQGENGGVGDQLGGTGGETGHSENVYVPPYTELTGEGVDIELPAECVANPETCGSLLTENPTQFGDEASNVPYSQVFGDYQDAAYAALEDDYIPLGLKGFIRDYFSSLEPQ